MSKRVSEQKKLIEIIRIVALEGPLSVSDLTRRFSEELGMHYRTARSAIGRLLPLLIEKGAIVELDKVGPRGTKYVDITPKGCDAALFSGILDYSEVAGITVKHVNELKRPLARAIEFIYKEVFGRTREEKEPEEAAAELLEHLDELETTTWDDVLEDTLIDPLVYHSHWEEFGLSRELLKDLFEAYKKASRDLKPYILQILEYIANMKEAESKRLEEEAKQYRASAENIRKFIDKERKKLFRKP
ncbi:hypothetical protein J4526_07570 [Desulfurococcaceae archaeon MEX13E-LK6-19]|nr:hypothetical protein J4526_07570 [Desulfurococcaceae archaeon MEX13E-LK6-19]